MRFLIAEDEYYARKALAQRVQSLYPEDTVIACENGLIALEEMQLHPCDILLLDIRMPEMDGLQVAHEVAKLHPNAYMMILTGYGEFRYAQDAIRAGVRDYLLKPVASADLEQALQKACDTVRNTRATKVPSSADTTLVTAMQAFLQNPGRPNPKAQTPGMMQCFLVFPATAPVAPLPDAWIAWEEDDGWVILAQTDPLHHLSDAVLSYFPDAHLAVSLALPWCEASEAIRQARLARSLKLLGTREVYTYTELHQLPVQSLLSASDEERFAASLSEDGRVASQIIQRVIATFVRERLSPLALHDAVMRLCTRMNHQMLIICKTMPSEQVPLVEIDTFAMDQPEALEQALNQAVMRLLAMRDQPMKSQDDAVAYLKAYIEEHYDENISMQALAENRLFLNTSYLSRLFRQKTGVSFREYLTSYRLEQAKIRLETESYESILSIGARCGYADASQFIALFRRAYGVTPSVYRKQHQT